MMLLMLVENVTYMYKLLVVMLSSHRIGISYMNFYILKDTKY